jgi:hypothetical protein
MGRIGGDGIVSRYYGGLSRWSHDLARLKEHRAAPRNAGDFRCKTADCLSTQAPQVNEMGSSVGAIHTPMRITAQRTGCSR